MSISSRFYSQIFCTKALHSALFYVHVTREKLPKRRSYEKGAHKMLMKLTTGVFKGGRGKGLKSQQGKKIDMTED